MYNHLDRKAIYTEIVGRAPLSNIMTRIFKNYKNMTIYDREI